MILQPLGVLTIIVFWPANNSFLRFRFACTYMYTYASGSRKPLFSAQNPTIVRTPLSFGL